jgi:hypothetical protein
MVKAIIFRNPKKRVILTLAFITLLNGLYAQTEFPGEDYWSFDTGFGMTNILVKGRSYQFIIDPKLWISPFFMVGTKLGVGYSTDKILSFEEQIYLRWNFLHPGSPEKTVNIFFQGGVGLLTASTSNSPFGDMTKSRGSLMADASLGITIPLSSRWHIEPSIRGGYPHIAGISLTAGYKFPVGQSAKQGKRPSTVEFIIFGPNTGQYNTGIDTDARGLNEITLNSIAQMLKDHPDYRVRIEGHANPVTNEPDETDRLMALSKMRADAVARQLKAKNIKEEQMIIDAYGGARTITSDHDTRNRNRRVELIVIQVNS